MDMCRRLYAASMMTHPAFSKSFHGDGIVRVKPGWSNKLKTSKFDSLGLIQHKNTGFLNRNDLKTSNVDSLDFIQHKKYVS